MRTLYWAHMTDNVKAMLVRGFKMYWGFGGKLGVYIWGASRRVCLNPLSIHQEFHSAWPAHLNDHHGCGFGIPSTKIGIVSPLPSLVAGSTPLPCSHHSDQKSASIQVAKLQFQLQYLSFVLAEQYFTPPPPPSYWTKGVGGRAPRISIGQWRRKMIHYWGVQVSRD